MLRATRGRGRSSEAPRPPAERNSSEREDAAPESTRGFWARARYYDQLTGVFAISRRYFVIGAFDGALTVLGLILGAAGYSTNPALILSAGLATSVALAISSTFGAYEAERVEQDLANQEVQTAMLRVVGGDKVKAHRFATIVSSLIHGVAPLVAGLLPLIPFLFVPSAIPFYEAVAIAIGVTLAFLFALGAYLGTITKKGMIKAGVRLVAIAILTAIASYLIGGHAFT